MGWTIAPDSLAETERQPARDQVSRQDEQKNRGPAPEHRREQSQDEPDKSGVADVREGDEEVIEQRRPVMDDPALESRIKRNQAGTSCFVDSIRCCGLKGLPMKPCAPLEVAVLSDCSSTLPLNMITGIAPTP